MHTTATPSTARPRSVVCLSGGMDSCVTAALAARDTDAYGLHFSYGQRTEARELLAAAVSWAEVLGFSDQILCLHSGFNFVVKVGCGMKQQTLAILIRPYLDATRHSQHFAMKGSSYSVLRLTCHDSACGPIGVNFAGFSDNL